MTARGDRYVFVHDVAPQRLWRVIADTDATDRDTGFPPVTYGVELQPGELPATVARTRFGPFRFAWDELPFTWEAPHRWSVERRFRGGPFVRFVNSERITALPDGRSRLEHLVELEPRNALGALLAPLVLAYGRIRAARAQKAIGERARLTPPLPVTRAAVPDVAPAGVARVARFVDALERLRPHEADDPEIAARLASLVEHGDDATVALLRPYVLADAWGLSRPRVLTAMLAATRAGLLDLSWRLACPSCRGPKNRVDTLAELGENVHCEACGIAYGPELDRNVEVVFDAAPSGRSATPPVFCTGGPYSAPQSLGQIALAPAGRATLELELERGAYVVQSLPSTGARFLVEDDAGAAAVEARTDGGRVRLSTSAVAAGRVRFDLRNDGERTVLVRITEAEYSDQMATAADVTALQPFRDLFSSEVLGEGIELSIRSMTLLFSDIVGSTQMYADDGDARAFRLVREHFDALREIVHATRGAIVKTIGDAVMAVFVDPRDAVAAALRFEAAVAPLALRIGLHRGPCIAMRANDRLDYFGGTVNVASRVAHLAARGEILMTATVADDPRVEELLLTGERGTVALRGIAEPVEVLRVRTAETLATVS